MKTNYERAGRIKASTKKMECLASNGRKMSKTDEKWTDQQWQWTQNIKRSTSGEPIKDENKMFLKVSKYETSGDKISLITRHFEMKFEFEKLWNQLKLKFYMRKVNSTEIVPHSLAFRMLLFLRNTNILV